MKAPRVVIVADSARARLFVLMPCEATDGSDAVVLQERTDLVSAGRRARPSEVFTDSRPGSHRASAHGGPGHGVDDHRDAHVAEIDRRFADDVIAAAGDLCADVGAKIVIVIAPPQMLSRLRRPAERLTGQGLRVKDHAGGLTHLSPTDLHDHLSKEGFAPARSRHAPPSV